MVSSETPLNQSTSWFLMMHELLRYTSPQPYVSWYPYRSPPPRSPTAVFAQCGSVKNSLVSSAYLVSG